jgi:hypothetical protein
MEKVMSLTIVWRNPATTPKGQSRVELLGADEYGALYSVIRTDVTTAFELILGSAAQHSVSDKTHKERQGGVRHEAIDPVLEITPSRA